MGEGVGDEEREDVQTHYSEWIRAKDGYEDRKHKHPDFLYIVN